MQRALVNKIAGVMTTGLVVLVAGPAAAESTAATVPDHGGAFRPGSAGLGDPYFPLLGNGGYRAKHYDLDLSYRPDRHFLSGTVTLTARATQNLSRFDLDLSGMHVAAVRVDGIRAHFDRAGQELRITPMFGLRRGRWFRVSVRYSGTPKTVTGSPIVFGADYGWQYTKDGAFVGDEPNAAHTWFPCDDHPTQKASFDFHITVPSDRTVIANGEPSRPRTDHGRTTYRWNEHRPMATYLATIDIGKWNVRSGRTPHGIREIAAFDPVYSAADRTRIFTTTGRVTDYWSRMFGRYPFGSTGAIDDSVPSVGFSLETQTRPLYGYDVDSGTMAHELAHQWFGDSVSVRDWSDVWLNEGFATFAAQLWGEHTGGSTTWQDFQSTYQRYPADSSFWKLAVADPGRDTMFAGAVYARGGMTLAALRHTIGDHAFFTLLRRWTGEHRYGNGDTAQFVHLAEQVAHRNLNAFFHAWLWSKTKPTGW